MTWTSGNYTTKNGMLESIKGQVFYSLKGILKTRIKHFD